MNGTEWEEEQVRLDRDWYSYDDEGAVVSITPDASQF
jgi:pre-mRNA-splicing factor ATP-dependent RNA helicase DHX38/PRP16